MLSVTMAALNASQKEMNVTSNNLANASTVGFKRSYANFGDVFSNDPASNPKTAVGAGVLLTSVARDTTAGALKSTGRVTDLAVDGRGFFVTKDPAGGTNASNTYSRAGNFSIDADGNLVDPGGFVVQGFNATVSSGLVVPGTILGGVTIPPTVTTTGTTTNWPAGTYCEGASPVTAAPADGSILQSISISPKGEVQATYSDNKTYTLRFVAIANFPSDQGLKAIGNNRYSETGLSGAASITGAGAPKAGNIMTGTLEQANVDITNELMDMIRSQQVYNGNARMLQTTIETVSRITDKI
jgi:flagellar hook protein FlgE